MVSRWPEERGFRKNKPYPYSATKRQLEEKTMVQLRTSLRKQRYGSTCISAVRPNASRASTCARSDIACAFGVTRDKRRRRATTQSHYLGGRRNFGEGRRVPYAHPAAERNEGSEQPAHRDKVLNLIDFKLQAHFEFLPPPAPRGNKVPKRIGTEYTQKNKHTYGCIDA